jgi:hypothetical protein
MRRIVPALLLLSCGRGEPAEVMTAGTYGATIPGTDAVRYVICRTTRSGFCTFVTISGSPPTETAKVLRRAQTFASGAGELCLEPSILPRIGDVPLEGTVSPAEGGISFDLMVHPPESEPIHLRARGIAFVGGGCADFW